MIAVNASAPKTKPERQNSVRPSLVSLLIAVNASAPKTKPERQNSVLPSLVSLLISVNASAPKTKPGSSESRRNYFFTRADAADVTYVLRRYATSTVLLLKHFADSVEDVDRMRPIGEISVNTCMR